MGKTLSLIIGGVVLFLGLVLLLMWWYEFLFILRGIVPAILILGGAIAILAGISELRDTQKSKKE